MLYFAYGSNMNAARMVARCPSAEPLGRAVLKDHALAERLYADIDGVPGAEVHGVLWRMKPADLDSLDRYEGYPVLYERFVTTVTLHEARARRRRGEPESVDVPAVVYIMTPAAKRAREGETWSAGYIDVCREGARRFGVEASPFWSKREDPD